MSAALLAQMLAAVPAFADVSAPADQKNGDVVILDAKQARACFRRNSGFFTPRSEDVHRLERLLPSALARFADEDPAAVMRELAQRVSSHVAADRRFWFGRTDESGRWLDVYGACPRLVERDNLCPPQAHDAMDCLWYVSFDLARHRFVRFDVHGVGTFRSDDDRMARAAAPQPRAQPTARQVAQRNPCELLSAIYDLPRSRDGQSKPADFDWSVSIQAGCCKDSRIEPLPALMSLGNGKTLIDWERSCGGGQGGPHRRPSSTVEFNYIHVYVKDQTTLQFNVTPGSEVFDKAGRNTNSVVSGCSSFRGEARLRDLGAPPPAN